jgi:glyoxylase-like metal-dependent hydrolase (beta-lactamase superfamily II)
MSHPAASVIAMHVLATGLRYADLDFQGVPSVIATAILAGREGVALVDPGPGSCLETLRARLAQQAIGIEDLTALLLTHIHLDHAGATGSLVQQNPRITVYVHERGAPHLADPRRLIESASRLYGDRMDALWGPFLAVPAANLRALGGGERIEAGGRTLEVAYTPGHASHHVSYFDAESRIAFVGDTAGVRIGASRFVIPPTPPPDIDLDAWTESTHRILAWRPETLFLTHFGPSAPPAPHIEELLERLRGAAGTARRTLDAGGTDAEQTSRFVREMRVEMRRYMSEAEARSGELAVPLDHCYVGLTRYWRKRAA